MTRVLQKMIAAVLFALSWLISLFDTSGMFHVVHVVWYLLRSFTFEDPPRQCSFNDADLDVPRHVSDIAVFAIVSMSQLPQGPGGPLSLGSFVWMPLTVHLVMGYPTPVWYVVVVSAFMCMAVSQTPQLLLVCTHLLWGIYHGCFKKWSLRVAALLHLCFAWTTFEFDWVSMASGLLAAEAKYRMMYAPHKTVETLSYLSILGVWSSYTWVWTLIPFVSNFTLFGWSKRWRYTDKVWYDADVCIFIGILLTAFGVSWFGPGPTSA